MLLVVMFSSLAFAQIPQQRTAETIIVDALNQLPANDQALYNRLMQDLESTGSTGIEMLMARLKNEDDSRVRIEYALNAYAAYAGKGGFDAQKRAELKAIIEKHRAAYKAQLTGDDAKDAAAKPWALTNYQFLTRMLNCVNGFETFVPAATPDVAPVQKNLKKLLKNKDREVRMEAINTINNFGTPEQKAASLAFAEGTLAKAKDPAKLDILYWMTLNPTIANTAVVKPLLNSKNAEVAKAAAWTLTRIGKKEDMDAVVALLSGTDEQKAVAKVCLKSYPGDVVGAIKAAQGANLTAEAKAVVDARTGADIPVVVLTPFEEYLASIKRSFTPAQKLLMLRHAMTMATNAQERNTVLNQVSKVRIFQSVIFAGQWIDNAETQQAAAQAIRQITSGRNEINGPEVRALLQKAHDVITGGDAGYQKTEIKQQLEKLAKEGEGFVSMFNGKDLTGWKGLLAEPYDNPYKRATLKEAELKKLQDEANEVMRQTWSVKDGCIVFNGKGRSLATEKKYGNFEMYVDWKLHKGPEADAGIYLRGTPQVQIWDIARTNVGAEVGSGGLYNNQKNESKPKLVADNPVGEWNSFYIKMVDERVTVHLNGKVVVDNVVMENYWDRNLPLMLKEQIELQAHGSVVEYRDLYIRELPQVEPIKLSKEEEKAGFKLMFDGTNLSNFIGDFTNYRVENGEIAVNNWGHGFGNLYLKEQYSDFIFRFEFKLTPGANNGIGIRADYGKDAAYHGMEIQVLDHFHKIYEGLGDHQFHGSVYGIIPTKDKNQLKPVGEWNTEEIYMKGDYIRVTLNGVVITEGNIREACQGHNVDPDGGNKNPYTVDKKNHPGLFNKTGYIGFLGHGSELWYRNVRIKRLK